MNDLQILKRLYNDYTRKYIYKILLSVFFSLIVAGSTSAIAWLLDPAIEKIFIEKDQSLILLIPLAIIIAFSLKKLTTNTVNAENIDDNDEYLNISETTTHENINKIPN